MMFGIFATIFGAALLNALGSAASTCPTTNVPNKCCVPSQVLFLVDASQSISLSNLNNVFDYVARTRSCLFEDGRAQMGLITFGTQIRLDIPLASYSAQNWTDQVNTIKASFAGQNDRYFTPMAEAFWLARQVFATAASASPVCKSYVNRVTMVISDGAPHPNLVDSSPVPPGGISPIPTTWLGISGTVPISQIASTPRLDINYDLTTTPNQARLLKADGVRVILVALNDSTETSPKSGRIAYFKTGRDPYRTCAAVANKYSATMPIPSTFCSNKGIPSGQNANSQCWGFRKTIANGGGFMDPTVGANWACLPYTFNPNDGMFPIATDDNHVVDFTDAITADALLRGAAWNLCPLDTCFP